MDGSEGQDNGMRIGRHMARGTLWMVFMRWTIRVIGLINTAIIARLLLPEDFGLVALAMIAVDLTVNLTDGDIDMALVRSTETGPALSDTGWTLKILAGLATAGLLCAAAPLVAAYFGDARLAVVVRIAALRPAILGFENIAVIEFRRTLRFSAECRYLVIQRLMAFVLGLGLVFAFRNYLALTWAGPAASLATVALSYAMAPGRPHLRLTRWRELWRFSRWQLLFNGTRVIGERCDQFVIGHLASLTSTGLYAVGFDLAMMPTREIMMPAGRALLPTYARIAHDPAQLKAAFSMVLGVGAVIASSAGIGMSCVAEDAVLILLGEQWREAVPFVRWLGVFGALEGLWLMLDPYLIAARRERSLAVFNLAFTAMIVPAVAMTATHFGVSLIPACRITAMTAALALVLSRLVVWQWISPRQLAATLWRPFAAALAMACAVTLLRLGADAPRLLSLFHDMAIGVLAYGGSLLALWWFSGAPDGVERTFIHLAADRFLHGASGGSPRSAARPRQDRPGKEPGK